MFKGDNVPRTIPAYMASANSYSGWRDDWKRRHTLLSAARLTKPKAQVTGWKSVEELLNQQVLYTRILAVIPGASFVDGELCPGSK